LLRKIMLCVTFFIVVAGSFALYLALKNSPANDQYAVSGITSPTSISNIIGEGETLSAVFKKHGLSIDELFAISQAAASVHKLKELHPGRPYNIIIDDKKSINSFTYGIDDSTILKIERVDGSFRAQKSVMPYESRVLTIGGQIEDNLISAIGTQSEDHLLALQVSDILAWDIDFTCDLRRGDTFKIVVEGLYHEGKFKKYGKILSAEFINNKQKYLAYRFEYDGNAGYYDASGKSLRRAFLKAPLSFRRISSSYTRKRLHPILRIYRPHRGVDYVAAAGSAVSATADGNVVSAGYQGDYGKLVVIAHRNGYKTFYGHLSRIKQDLRQGREVKQSDVIGYVGSTGLSSGPHLHYEIRQGGSHVNPLRFKVDAGKAIPFTQMTEFQKVTGIMDKTFASAAFYNNKKNEQSKTSAMNMVEQNEYYFRLN
jgi:murein DD-endopeptidase MepM/ murein hydrolase activator NlpD